MEAIATRLEAIAIRLEASYDVGFMALHLKRERIYHPFGDQISHIYTIHAMHTRWHLLYTISTPTSNLTPLATSEKPRGPFATPEVA